MNRYTNLGYLHAQHKKYKSAEDYLNKALSFREDDFNPKRDALIFQNLGDISKDKGIFPKALNYYEDALKLSMKGNMLPRMKEIYFSLSEIYKDNKDYQKSILLQG